MKIIKTFPIILHNLITRIDLDFSNVFISTNDGNAIILSYFKFYDAKFEFVHQTRNLQKERFNRVFFNPDKKTYV